MNLSILLLVIIGHGEIFASENNSFVPTNEWQEIREGQGIPAGLHIRINLQTGKKEAKLLEEDQQSDTSNAALATLPGEIIDAPDPETDENVPEQIKREFLIEQQKISAHNGDSVVLNSSESSTEQKAKLKKKITLTEALKNLRKNQISLDFTEEKLRQIKREYKELQDSVDEMKKNFKSDAEVISLLMQDFKNVSKVEVQEYTQAEKTKNSQLLRILDNLNYLVHQIDNALWFIDHGGLDGVLLPMVVNQTNIALRVQSLRVLGALTQNNPKAQIKVFEKNFGIHLAQVLISSTNTDELSTALYAFGSLLRKFPVAQQRLLSKSGIQALVTVIAKESELKVKAKAITIINDVIVEKTSLMLGNANDSEDDALIAAQFVERNLPDWLHANAYCDTVDAAITSKLYEFLEHPDLTEYFVNALTNTESLCHLLWSQSPQLRHTLLTLMNRFMRSGEEYRMEVAESIEKLVRSLYEASSRKDEL